MTNLYQHVYLSPHYDDVSLSCGGTVHRQTQAGEAVLVVTICAAPPQPGEPLSPLTQAMHARWGDPADVVATRRAEDQASVTVLGADFQRLGFKDCIYRGQPRAGEWYYNRNADIFGTIHPADKALSDEIARAVIELVSKERTLIYAPLTVGHHVDHQLTHLAAWQLHQMGYTVSFYEDYPYADPEYRPYDSNNSYPLQTTLATLQAADLQPELRFLSEANLAAKIDSIRAYASQLEMLFGDDAKMATRVRDYALQVGDGQLAERIWIP
jgi:LmbE family N-acetylglucosaminyl deacetylase